MLTTIATSLALTALVGYVCSRWGALKALASAVGAAAFVAAVAAFTAVSAVPVVGAPVAPLVPAIIAAKAAYAGAEAATTKKAEPAKEPAPKEAAKAAESSSGAAGDANYVHADPDMVLDAWRGVSKKVEALMKKYGIRPEDLLASVKLPETKTKGLVGATKDAVAK